MTQNGSDPMREKLSEMSKEELIEANLRTLQLYWELLDLLREMAPDLDKEGLTDIGDSPQ